MDPAAGYNWRQTPDLDVGVKNLFDRDPPFTNRAVTFQSGYDPVIPIRWEGPFTPASPIASSHSGPARGGAALDRHGMDSDRTPPIA